MLEELSDHALRNALIRRGRDSLEEGAIAKKVLQVGVAGPGLRVLDGGLGIVVSMAGAALGELRESFTDSGIPLDADDASGCILALAARDIGKGAPGLVSRKAVVGHDLGPDAELLHQQLEQAPQPLGGDDDERAERLARRPHEVGESMQRDGGFAVAGFAEEEERSTGRLDYDASLGFVETDIDEGGRVGASFARAQFEKAGTPRGALWSTRGSWVRARESAWRALARAAREGPFECAVRALRGARGRRIRQDSCGKKKLPDEGELGDTLLRLGDERGGEEKARSPPGLDDPRPLRQQAVDDLPPDSPHSLDIGRVVRIRGRMTRIQ